MGLFDRFKKTKFKEDDSHINDSPNEYKYSLKIPFDLSTTSRELINKKVASFEATILDQMTVLSAEVRVDENPYEDDENLVIATIDFTGLAQFRFENEVETNQDLNSSFPLVSSNMGLGFWMKGGVFSFFAQELFSEASDTELPTSQDITFYNDELSMSYDVTLEKDSRGFCRMSDWN